MSEPAESPEVEEVCEKPRRRIITATLLDPQSTTFVPYRGDKDGLAALYDHIALQTCMRICTQDTVGAIHRKTAWDATDAEQRKFKDRKAQRVITLDEPVFSNNCDHIDIGLLFIPGRHVDNMDDMDRKAKEDKLIEWARLRGQPILGVCAGALRVWAHYGGTTKDVTDHSYNGGMLRVSDTGSITYNKQIHRVEIIKDSLLARACKITPRTTTSDPEAFFSCSPHTADPEALPSSSPHASHSTDPPAPEQPQDTSSNAVAKVEVKYVLNVNSVHKKTPREAILPIGLYASAYSIKSSDFEIKRRKQEPDKPMLMEPEVNVVEAFESFYGAPVLGIMWHPEGYVQAKSCHSTDQFHRNIIMYMIKAGDAYAAKRRMMELLLSTRARFENE